jgi:hypothetical protein
MKLGLRSTSRSILHLCWLLLSKSVPPIMISVNNFIPLEVADLWLIGSSHSNDPGCKFCVGKEVLWKFLDS